MRVSIGRKLAAAALAVASILVGGGAPSSEAPARPSEVAGAAAFGDPLEGLSAVQRRAFDAGFQLFIKQWKRAEGLGPNVNADNCIACHAEPMPGGSGTESRTFVPQVKGAPIRPSPAGVFQRFSVATDGVLMPRTVPDGVTMRRTPPLFGLGLLEAVAVEELLRQSERNRQRSDGVRGLIVRIDGTYCRFGWNGNFATIDDVVSFALFAEMGLTNPGRVGGRPPDVRADEVRDIAEFIRFLAPPPRRQLSAAAAKGEKLFEEATCDVCHRSSLVTSPAAPAPLGDRVIHPYTDLLVHDMGDDARRSIRTPPLWGLSSTGPPFLHDGRAKTVEEAILLHAGEAEASVTAYGKLNREEKTLLLEFLDSL